MIVFGGENVYSAEVENALSKHPAVAACAVIGVPDGEWGERVHAMVVVVDGVQPTADELRDHVKQHIAGYKAPRTVEFVGELPLSGAGKVLKRALRSRHWDGRDRMAPKMKHCLAVDEQISGDLHTVGHHLGGDRLRLRRHLGPQHTVQRRSQRLNGRCGAPVFGADAERLNRKSTRLNSSLANIS